MLFCDSRHYISLRRHNEDVHAVRTHFFSCPECRGKRFSTKNVLGNHMFIKHQQYKRTNLIQFTA